MHHFSSKSHSIAKLFKLLSVDHRQGGNIEDDWEFILDPEIASGDDDDQLMKEGENDDQEDDELFNFPSALIQSNFVKAKYTILSSAEVLQLLEDKVKEVSTVLLLLRNDAALLLQHFKWDVNRTNDEWLACEKKVRKAVGLFVRPVVDVPADAAEIACIRCYTDFPSDALFSVSCGHKICVTCWEDYISEAINDGPRCLTLRCPQLSCDAALGPYFIGLLSSKDDKKMFENYLLRSYLTDCHKGKWCPAPGCNYAVIDFNGEESKVTCRCSHSFCWTCTDEVHAPVDCETLARWMSEVVSQSENWMIAYTTTCPMCKASFDRFGSDYEMCVYCYNRFCSVCGGEWSDNYTDGRVTHYSCITDNSAKMSLLKKSLEKFNHYYKEWANCGSNRANALTDLKLLQDLQLEFLSGVFGIHLNDLDFLAEALLQVAECWQFLRWTYVYGYYLPEKEAAKKHLLEFMQDQALSLVQRLHNLVEDLLKSVEEDNPFARFLEYQRKITRLTRVVKEYFDRLMEGLKSRLSEVVCTPNSSPRPRISFKFGLPEKDITEEADSNIRGSVSSPSSGEMWFRFDQTLETEHQPVSMSEKRKKE